MRTDYISDPYVYGKTVDAALSGYNGTIYTSYTDADYEKLKQVITIILLFIQFFQGGSIQMYHEN